ncbi:protein prune homolog 2-like isoform X1 [Argonauta hians]
MENYLARVHENLGHLSNYKTVHVVLGNESADPDSVISSLVEAYYLNQADQGDDDVVVIPVVNIKRRDVRLRRVLGHVLKQQGIRCEVLLYRDDVDLHQLHFQHKLKLTLVDNNVLPLKDHALEDCVVSVIDHRPRERPESSDCKTCIEPVGSCCTLIAHQIFHSPFVTIIDDKVAALLFSVIIVDTMNMNKEAKIGTDKDEEMLRRLETILPGWNRADTLEQIYSIKHDTSGFSSLDLLEMDLKVISDNDINIAMSSISKPIEDFVKMDELEASLYKLCELYEAKAVVIMCMFTSNEDTPKRDLAVFSMFKPVLDKIVGVLCSSSEPSLGLERLPFDLPTLTIFSQNNVTVTRKKVLPVLKSLISKENCFNSHGNSHQMNEACQETELASGCGGVGDGDGDGIRGGVDGSGGDGGGDGDGGGGGGDGHPGLIEYDMKPDSKCSDTASYSSGTDTSNEMMSDTFSPTTTNTTTITTNSAANPTTNTTIDITTTTTADTTTTITTDRSGTMQVDNAVYSKQHGGGDDTATDQNNSHIVLGECVDNSVNHADFSSTIDNMHFLNKQHNVDNIVCMTAGQPLITVGSGGGGGGGSYGGGYGGSCGGGGGVGGGGGGGGVDKVQVLPEASSGIASPMEIVSDQTSEQGSSYPVTPPNSFMDSNLGSYMKDYHLPSFNSAEMVQRINDKKASLHPYEDAEVCGYNNSGGDGGQNPSSSFPYTPQNSFVESEFDSSFAKSITPDSIEDILGKIDEANNHSRASINPDYAKRSNGENIGFHCCSDFETETVSEKQQQQQQPIDRDNVDDVAYSLVSELIQNTLENYPYQDQVNESEDGEEKRVTPLVKSRSEGTTIDLSIKSECPKSQSDVINLSNVLETDYARQFDPFNGSMEYSPFPMDYSDYMAERGVVESASKISWGSYSDDVTLSSESTKSEEGVKVKKSESCDNKNSIVNDVKIKSSNSLPEVSSQTFPKILKPPESILSSIDDNLSDLTMVSPTKSNLAHDISNSDMEGELALEDDSDLDDGEKDFAAQLREKLTQIGNNSQLTFAAPHQHEGIFSPEELKSGVKRMTNLKASDLNQIANFSAEDLREKLEKIALDETGAVGSFREFTYDSDSDSETSLATLEGAGSNHTNESASLSPRPLSSGLMEIIEENEEEEEDEGGENCDDVFSKTSETLKSFQNMSLFNRAPLQQYNNNNNINNNHNNNSEVCASPHHNKDTSVVTPELHVVDTTDPRSSAVLGDCPAGAKVNLKPPEPVVLRRHPGNKEVFHTTAGRISISIDGSPNDAAAAAAVAAASQFNAAGDRENSEEIGILDYKQTHREVGEILARVKNAIMSADAELMSSSSSSSLCPGVDVCLQNNSNHQPY